MKFKWRGKWKKGEVIIETETLEELDHVLGKLFSLGEVHEPSRITDKNSPLPDLPSGLGCSDAIKTLLQTEWGKQPRSMAELKKALEVNALYFSKGTLSGTLTMLTKKGHLKRFKKAGIWSYILKQS
ncbi:MAG: hypothetical protein ACFFDI_27635 [Promethearchaeota archaeon]